MNYDYENLINSLVSDGYLKTASIIDAFKKIDRVDFVLGEYKDRAYENVPLPIGFDQTISQPLTVAFMLELLQPRIGEKILEIGSGSGWQTALISECVSAQKTDSTSTNNVQENSKINGSVIGIERIPKLVEMSKINVSKYGFLENKIANIFFGDGTKGYKDEAPYDRIIASAAVQGEIPLFWRRQLKIGGRIVAPFENSIIVIDKISKNKYVKKDYFGFSFVPLVKD